MFTFKYGDCKDACIGTILLNQEIFNPEVFLFGDLRFTLRNTDDIYRSLELSYRAEEYMDIITKHAGVTFNFHYPKSVSCYIEEINALLHNKMPVIIVVDHFEYPPSQFYQSLNMPHYTIITSYDPDLERYSFVDPFPFYDKQGFITKEELIRYTDSPALNEHRNVYFYLDFSRRTSFHSLEYLQDTYLNVLTRNVEQMVQNHETLEMTNGIFAVRRMADYVDHWVNNPESFKPYEGKSKKFPINSFLDMGNNRSGHALYLKTLGTLFNHEGFLQLSREFTKITAYWNTVSSLRHLYQEENISSKYEISSDFIIKKLKKVPKLLQEIAVAEEEALQRLETMVEHARVKGSGSRA